MREDSNWLFSFPFSGAVKGCWRLVMGGTKGLHSDFWAVLVMPQMRLSDPHCESGSPLCLCQFPLHCRRSGTARTLLVRRVWPYSDANSKSENNVTFYCSLVPWFFCHSRTPLCGGVGHHFFLRGFFFFLCPASTST